MSFPHEGRLGQDFWVGDDNAPYIPTPKEIKLRAAEIRKTWSKHERQKRMGAYKEIGVSLQQASEPVFHKSSII